MAKRGRGSANAMTNDTGPEFSEGQKNILDRLKARMGQDSHLLNALNFDEALISLHQDGTKLFVEPPMSPHRVEIGTTNEFGKNTLIYAYMFKHHNSPWNMHVVCYIFPSPGERGVLFHPNDLYRGVGTLHESLKILTTPTLLNTMLKLYFIHQGFKAHWMDFSHHFIECVKDLCRFWAENSAASVVRSEQIGGVLTRNGPREIATNGPAEEHEESPGPSTTVLKRERHSTPPIQGDDSVATLSDPTIHPAPRTRTKNPTRPQPTPPNLPKPTIDGAQLSQLFTRPMETAKTKESSMAAKVQKAKHRLEEHNAHIEELWSQIGEADQKKLKLEKKVESYERRYEESKQVQKELLERLDPDVRSFIKAARELDIESEERDVKRVKRG